MIKFSVTFAGLCLYVINADDSGASEAPDVTVLLPDARGRDSSSSVQHADGTTGDRHVGYVRLDYANLDGRFPPGASDGPEFELVHRLDGEELFFDFAQNEGDAIDVSTVDVPHVNKFAPGLMPYAGVLQQSLSATATPVLFRTVLRGGKKGALWGQALGKDWVMSPALNDQKTPYGGQFAGSIRWSCEIDASEVNLVLRKFDGSRSLPITLKPVKVGGQNVINLKIANLCAHNPLEWHDYEKVPVMRDEDFKWLYRLLTPSSGADYPTELAGAELPYPRLAPHEQPQGDEGCTGLACYQTYALSLRSVF